LAGDHRAHFKKSVMDSLTHLVLGACTGEVILGKKLGKKAMLYGAIIANIPDIDIIAGLFVPGDKSLLLHRGITHSFFFAVVLGLCLAWLANRRYPKISFPAFAYFCIFQLALHDLLDTCTSYGTGLLEPFSSQRFSFHLLYVADPLFTLPLLIAAVILLFNKPRHRMKYAYTAIIISLLYVGFAFYNKVSIDKKVNASFTTPAPFNTMLWYCILKTDSGFYTGYRSIFDKSPIGYTYHPKNDFLLKQPEVSLKTFADGYYTITGSGQHLYFNVIRFGEIHGWQTKNAPFALSYPLNSQGGNNMIIQKGRLTGWNKNSIKQYLERILGK
jgi:inner membrane protein